MKSKCVTLSAIAVLLLTISLPALAHHGNAAYDESREVTLKGRVTEFVWANPHAQIYFDVKAGNGKIIHWGCETLSPGKLLRAGWTKDSVKVGDQMTITLVAAKNGSPVGILRKLVFDDGKMLSTNEMPQQ